MFSTLLARLRALAAESKGSDPAADAVFDDVVAALTRDRIITTSTAPRPGGQPGEPTAELIHDALIRDWGNLHKWLDRDRRFQIWLHRATEQNDRYTASGRSEYLLTGTDLAEGLDWARQRPLPPDLTTFLAASRARERRAVRIWRTVTAVLVALVVTAGVLVAVTVNTNNRLQGQLATANAKTLADRAAARWDEADVATQLALAAWRTDPDSPDARTALANQYVATLHMDRVFSFTDQPVERIQLSDDRRTALLSHRAEAVVVTGVRGDEPKSSTLAGVPAGATTLLSRDGRRVVAVDKRDAMLTWDTANPGSPTVLARGGEPRDDPVVAAFSPDGERLVQAVADSGSLRLRVWNLRTGTPVRTNVRVPPTTGEVWLTPDERSALVRTEPAEDKPARVTKYELRTGEEAGELPKYSTVADSGRVVVRCLDPEDGPYFTISVSDSVSNRELYRRPVLNVGDCDGLDLTADGRYLFDRPGFDGPATTAIYALDLRTGTRFSIDAPLPSQHAPEDETVLPDERNIGRAGYLTGMSNTDGTATFLSTQDTSVFRFPVVRPNEIDARGFGRPILSLDGRYLIWTKWAGPDYEVFDAKTGEHLTTLSHDELANDGQLVTENVERTLNILVATGSGYVYARHALPDLEVIDKYTLPRQCGLPDDPAELSANPQFTETKQRIIVLCNGTLAAWDRGTGELDVKPVSLARTARERKWYRTRQVIATARPNHPNQVAIRGPDGHVRLWDLRTGEPARSGLAAAVEPGGTWWGHFFEFDREGQHLIVLDQDRRLRRFDADTGRAVGDPIQTPSKTDALLGQDSDGRVLTRADDPFGENLSSFGNGIYDETVGVSFWDFESGKPTGSLRSTLPAVLTNVRHVTETGWVTVTDGVSYIDRLEIDADRWFDHLCGLRSRPYSKAELALLPDGVSTEPPCD